MIFSEIILLFGFETENSKAEFLGAWTCNDKLSDWVLRNRHTVYAFEAVKVPKDNLCPELVGVGFKRVVK